MRGQQHDVHEGPIRSHDQSFLNEREGRRRRAGRAWTLVVVSATFSLCVAARTWGAPPERMKDACEAQHGKPAPGENDPNVFDRLKCKQQGLVDQMAYMVDNSLTQGMVSGPLSEGQKNLARSARARSASAHGASNRDSFRGLAKAERKANTPQTGCVLVELTGDGDGICDPDPPANEVCASTDDPPVACDPRKKHPNPKRDPVCAQLCEAETSQETLEEERQEQRVARDLEDAYDALEEDTRGMNERLDALNTELSQAAARASVAQTTDSCSDLADLPSALTIAADLLRVAAVTTRGIADIANTACGQTVVVVAVAAGFGGGGGGNGSVACTVVETVTALVALAHTAVDIILNNSRDALNEQTFDCLQQAILDISSVKGAVDNSTAQLVSMLDRNQQETIAARAALASQIEQIRGELAAMIQEALALLNTPQGLRPDFPTD